MSCLTGGREDLWGCWEGLSLSNVRINMSVVSFSAVFSLLAAGTLIIESCF